MFYTARMSLRSRLSASFVLIFVCHSSLAAETLWQDQPLRDYIAWLASQDIAIIYSSDLVRPEYRVTTEPVNPNSIAALRETLQPYGLSLAQGPGDSLLIVRRQTASGHIDLTVMEAGTAFGIADVRVFVGGKLLGVTDGDGKLAISDQEPGTLELLVAASGYIDVAPNIIELATGQTLPVRIYLQPLQQALPEIVVTSSLYSLRYDPAGSHTFLDRDLTTKLPDVGDDAVRSIGRLPGVANGGVSTRNHVRGGVNNEQLFLFDGLRLYEPYHLKDFHALSTIVDQNAIAAIDFYSAGYQVPYGDRMSGVVDISLRDPPSETVTELGLSFFSASVLSMGRFGNSDRGDWLVTGRRGNLDLVVDVVNSNYGTPRYEDTMFHVGWELSDRSYVSANALLSYDKISVSELDDSEHASAKYRNRIFWFKVDTAWSRNLSSSTILSATLIDNDRVGDVDVPDMNSGNVTDDRNFQSVTLKQDWQWAATSKWLFSSGFDIKRLEAEYKYNSTLNIFPPFDQILDNQPLLVRNIQTAPRGAQYAVYLGSRWRPFEDLILDAGIRWDQQTYTTASDDSQTSPRFNVLYNWGERTELRLGFGMFYQAQEINELQVADGVTTFFAAQRAQHAVASLSHELTSGIDIRVELYKKRYRQLMPRYENVFDPLVLIPELQIDRVRIDAEAAVSKGVEFMVTGENSAESLLWWLSYTWSVIEDSTDEGTVKRSWDQSHTVKAGINWDWNKWSISAAGSVHTGWPRTDLMVETISNPDGSSGLVASTTPRNALRHSVFHSIDARASRRFDVSRGELTVFLEITNLYNRQNPCCTKYRLQTDNGGNQSLTANQGNWLPIIPSLGVSWRF
jgi:outer membrane receptor protein involved in Fe transport